MHRLVEQLYRDDPAKVIRFALANLERWRQQEVFCEDYGIWEGILRHRPQLLPKILCGSDEEAVRLRQSSPFAGLIPDSVRRDLLKSAP